MSTRLQNAWTPSKVRERIKAGVLQQRLQQHALGKIEMSATQVKAATYLLDQALGRAPQPITGDPNNPLQVRVISYAAGACATPSPSSSEG